MRIPISDTMPTTERLRMKMADEDMAYRFRLRAECDRRARIRAGNRALSLVGRLGPESRARWTARTMAARNKAARGMV